MHDVRAAPIHYLIPKEAFRSRMLQRIEDCKEAILASAFFTFPAFQAFKPVLQSALDNGARIRFLIGRFDFVTEPRAVDGLLRLEKKYPERLGIFFDSDYGFHFKLATFNIAGKKTVIIGSSNLTEKGLHSVGEANLEIIKGQSVYSTVKDCLDKRISDAARAVDGIDEYRREYKRAKKYRDQKLRWLKRASRKWKQRRKLPVHRGIPGTRFYLCRINAFESDAELKKNIRFEHQSASKAGEVFPNQWVHVPIEDYRRVNESDNFVLCDDIAHTIGFAKCTKKIKVRNSQERLEPVIFYRYRRRWKLHFRYKLRYKRAVRSLGLGNQLVIGNKKSKALKSYLRSHLRS